MALTAHRIREAMFRCPFLAGIHNNRIANKDSDIETESLNGNAEANLTKAFDAERNKINLEQSSRPH